MEAVSHIADTNDDGLDIYLVPTARSSVGKGKRGPAKGKKVENVGEVDEDLSDLDIEWWEDDLYDGFCLEA